MSKEIRTLRDALARYGHHDYTCGVFTAVRDGKPCGLCDCGLDAALKGDSK